MLKCPITLPELFPVSEMPFCPPSTCWCLSYLSGSISEVSSSEDLYSTFPLSRDHNCSLLSVSRTPKQQWNDQFPILGFRSSVTKLCLTLRPHGLQHASLPCPSLSPRVCSNSHPLSQWCHPTISSSVIPFSSCPQFFPASGSFPVNRLFARWPKYWSFSISPSNEYLGLISFRMDWFDLLAFQGTLKSLLQHNSKASILPHSAFFMRSNSHICTCYRKQPLSEKWCIWFFLFFYFILFLNFT